MRLWLRFDRKEISVLSSRIVSLLVGPVTVLAVGIHLDPVVQGYYYTFGSILSASVFFEAGVSTAIVQFAAHESGYLRFEKSRAILGPRSARRRLSAVLRFAVAWFWATAAAMGAVVGAIGFLVFSVHDDGVDWVFPWILVVAISTVNFCIQPLFAFLEGTGRIQYVYRYRTYRSLGQSAVLILCITLGMGLYSLGVASGFATVVGLAFLIPMRRMLRVASWVRGKGALDWRREILPFQWRIAVSWAAGYFTVALFTPVMMLVRGPVDAGQVGMTVTLMVACTSLAASFMQAHAPSLGALHGAGAVDDMRALFRRKFRLSAFACLSLLAALFALVSFASWVGLPLVQRVVSVGALAFFAVGFLAYHLEGVLAFFMRAQKQEPYFLLEVLGAVLIFPSTLVLGHLWGPLGVGIGFSLVHLLVLLPISVVIFRRSYRAMGGEHG